MTLLTTRTDRTYRFAARDGAVEAIAVEEPRDWIASENHSSSGANSTSTQQPVAEPLILHRRRSMVAVPTADGGPPRSWRAPPGPTEGVLLWVEVDPGPPGPGTPARLP